MTIEEKKLLGKRKWFASRLIPILIVLGGVYIYDLEPGAQEALLASVALPFIVTEVMAFVREKLPSADISERAIDFFKEAWGNIRKGEWGPGITLIIGYAVACLAGFFFALFLEGKMPSLASFLIFLKYYTIWAFLVIGFYTMVSLFSIRGIRSLTFHGIVWGLIGISIVGYLNSLNDPEYLIKIGFVTQLTAFLFCVVSGGDELRSESREGQGKAIFLSLIVIFCLFGISYLCLGNTSVTEALNVIGFSYYGYVICLIGLAIFGEGTVIHGVASKSKGVSILGIIIFAAACLAAYLTKNRLTPFAMYEHFYPFIHSKEVYPFSGAVLISLIIFLTLSYKWLRPGKRNIGYPLAASLIPSVFFGAIRLLSPEGLFFAFGSSAIVFSAELFGIFIGLFITLYLVKNRENVPTFLLLLLLVIGTFSLTLPIWHGY